jgi:Rrf2 family protein
VTLFNNLYQTNTNSYLKSVLSQCYFKLNQFFGCPMLRLSKKVDYAIILLSHLGEASRPTSAQEMSSHYHLPQPMIANILKQLAASQLVESKRGVQGGYVLQRQADQISLVEIVRVIDGPFNFVECAHEASECRVSATCPTQTPLQALHSRLYEFMESVTLENLIQHHALQPV